MPFKINTNLSALDAYNALARVNARTNKAQLRLASQLRINSVADDTSGYRVGKELQGKVSLMRAAQGNIGAAKNTLSTAESALTNVNDLLIQIKGKVAEANDPTKNLTALANDINALGDEISAIFTNTKFNDTTLLSGSSVPSGSNFVFQTGETEKTTINFGTMNTLDLSSITGSGATSANITSISVSTIESAVQDSLGKIGNYIQRLDVKDDYLTNAITNATASISRLFDADMAFEQLNATKGQIGQQVATSMLAQLNFQPQSLLSLFQ
jgi:flagellin